MRATSARRAALLGATILAGYSMPVLAQTDAQPAGAPVPAAASPSQASSETSPSVGAPAAAPSTADPSATGADVEEVVVTGYRRSLAQSTTAKRNATGFTDSIFAEDIGKFPDLNIAESFNRIPGITISRDITGEGTNVAIRGLGSNFTQVTLNGAPIAVASSGATDAQGTDRSVDLSFFPTDLFTKLTVAKSYTPDLEEGGAAGNVDIRNARPFDNPGTHITYNLQGTKQSQASGWGERGSLIASHTSDTFGILAGVAANHTRSRTTGFETIGYTNPALSTPQSLALARNHPTPTAQDFADAQCATGCNSTGGGNFTIPGTVPANAGNGLVPGATLNQAALLALNPGATLQQIDNGLIPRLGRPSDEYGSRDRINGVVSAEWRPTDDLHFYIDGLYGWRKNDLRRVDMNWVGRNGATIPINETFDKTDCSAGCTVTGGTFANAQFFLEYRPYIETTKFWSANPGASWNITNNLKLNIQGNYTRSTFHRESPSVVVITPPSSGNTVTYTNDGGIPSITSNVDLNNPASFGWTGGGRVNIQDERRKYLTKGVRGDLTWGDEKLNVKIGGNYDDISRRIEAFDNSQAWQNAVCGNNPSVFLPSPNAQPNCDGLNVAGAAPAGYPTYPAYGTGYTAGMTGPVTYAGSLIPTSQLANFLRPGPDGFVTVDWNKFKQASNYDAFHDAAPAVGSANTGAAGGYIREQSPTAYVEVNGVQTVADADLRFNVGVRYVHTKQTISGLVSLTDPRNPSPVPASAQGSLYPNVVNTATTKSSYTRWLPAANFAYDIGEHAVARFAVSKTLTRADPNAQLPGVNFSSPSADTASIGNPALSPYTSKNIDLGVEYYTGHEGLVSVAAFRKELKGFTTPGISTVPFSALSAYGITFGSLTPTQQAAIISRGGENAASVQVSQQINASGTLDVNGMEFQWVQPLDFITERFGVKGFGFNANATIVDQKGSGAAPATALGVAKYTYNISGYYEHDGISLRVSTTFQKGSQVSSPNQNGIPSAALFTNNYRQTDFSSIFDLEKIFGVRHAPQVTFDVVNLTNSKLRTYFQFPNATFTQYKPGRQFLIGLRGSF
ncbi:TonB-dependent receptor [Sphingomonas crusticola]|uniref:TonB-dependent receptor n=1 Tax=Sphingomonas crusticola TaxID=1697973 RepID=UPI000E282161|nr:TonB-dependent receptor [Sphingomonas crusticola]